MCGIAGYFNLNFRQIMDTSKIISMLAVQRHRGPDDSGIQAFSLRSGTSEEFSTSDPVKIHEGYEGILGFNRLSILDLSINGHQPMISPDGKVLLTMNGEIYNAFDFKHELEEWGYFFKSTTDTEIVLALYLRYGFEGMLQRLNGMFAIVVVDMGRKELLVTRDRFGIKPMYYVSTSDTLAFSSELKSFRYIEDFHFRLREEQLDEYLLFRNNLDGTLIEGIESLAPGNYLSYRQETGVVKKCYFDLNQYSRSTESNFNLEDFGVMLKDWLSKSVKSQLMSDVKLGCQLSGGIDSSLVTWLANRSSERGNFEAVSIIFNNPAFSEEKYVDRVAEELAIPSHKFLLDSDYYFDNIEKATWHLEAPLNHPNTVAIYKLSQRAKEYVTVLLSGEGADEVFGGYTRFYDLNFPFHRDKVLHEIKKNRTHPIELINYISGEKRAVMATAFMTPTLANKIKSNFNKERSLGNRRNLYRALSGSLFDRQVKYEMLSFLPDLLIRQDKMSMAHSIENRVPFLDNEVVKQSFTIPEKYLLLRKSAEGSNTEKYLLKKMTSDVFGVDFAFRDKMGFGIPVREFFLNKKFQVYINDKVLPGIKSRNLFNHKLVAAWVANLSNLKYFELEALWVTVAFEIWASIYLDGGHENWDTRS
jgi:asparagine synthase (glutamine-hydrolysing)